MISTENEDSIDIEDIICSIADARVDAKSGFVVDTDEKALWAGRKVLQAELRIAQKTEMRKRFTALIDQWFLKATKEDAASIDFLKGLLKPYVVSALLATPRKRTIHLPGLSVSLRKLPDKAEVEDEKIAISFCEMHFKDAVEVKKSLSKTMLKQELLAGKVIPGVRLSEGADELYLSDNTRRVVGKEAHDEAA